MRLSCPRSEQRPDQGRPDDPVANPVTLRAWSLSRPGPYSRWPSPLDTITSAPSPHRAFCGSLAPPRYTSPTAHHRLPSPPWLPRRTCAAPTSVRPAARPLLCAGAVVPRYQSRGLTDMLHQLCRMPNRQRTRTRMTCRVSRRPPCVHGACTDGPPGTMASTLPMAAVSAASPPHVARLIWCPRSSLETSTARPI